MYPLGMTEEEHEEFMRWSMANKTNEHIRTGGTRSGLYQFEDSFEDCYISIRSDVRVDKGLGPDDCICSGGSVMPIGFWDRGWEHSTATL